MNTRWTRVVGVSGALLCSVLWLSATTVKQSPAPSEPVMTRTNPMPPPTEHWFERVAEGTQKRNRKAWFKEFHQAAPGVDWKQIERENGRAQLEKRNALAGTQFAQNGGYWVERGSDNQAGRMHVVAHSRDQKTIVAGSAKGGIWKRDLDGDVWRNIGDNLYGGAHWLAVVSAPSVDEPDIIVAATDWGAIHRTTDDGQTWTTPLGLPDGNQPIRRLIVTSDPSETMFIIRGSSNKHALYRSEDGGIRFEKILEMGRYKGDLWTSRTGQSTLYLTLDDSLWVSDDFGDNWSSIGFLNTGANRSELVGSEAGGPTLYSVTKKEGAHTLHRSEDGGATWQTMHDVEDYWSSLAASIEDPDLFAWGGVELHVTRDGGENFKLQNYWYDYYEDIENKLHADIPGIDVLPNPEGEGEIWYISTDGGLYHSVDTLDTVENLALQGLRVSQYYTTHTSIANANHVAAGAQDQGYQRTETELDADGLYSFTQHISGDYARHTSTDGSHNYLFSLYPGFLLIHIGEDSPNLVGADFPASERYAWLPAITADPLNEQKVYFGATRLYRYDRSGSSWDWYPTAVSDVLASQENEYISDIDFSPVDPALGWIITNQGRLFKTEDNAVTWTAVSMPTIEGHYFYGQALLPSKTERDTLTIGGNGYSNPGVYRTVDGGETWTDWSSGMPNTMVYCLGEPNDDSGVVFAGTETAAYRRGPEDQNWEDITSNKAPVTIYWSVEALHHENTMRFGTYGRGIWDFRLEGTPPCTEDLDDDGYTCDIDCNDNDASIHPDAQESCDGIDANCDSTDILETDEDGDGFLACEECDDTNRFVHPDARDDCTNGIDKNCNDQLDCDEEPVGGCACTSASDWVPVFVWLPLAFLWTRRRRGGAHPIGLQ